MKLPARWSKVVGDLRRERWKMVAIAASLFVSSLAVAAAFCAKSILAREVARSFEQTRPANAIYYLDQVPAELVRAVEEEGTVRAAERRRLVRARAEASPGEWLPLRLFVIDDFRKIRVSKFHSHKGAWPPPPGGLLVEESSLALLGDTEMSSIRVRVPGGKSAPLEISGVAHDPGQAPGWQDRIIYAYATPETVSELGLDAKFDELHVIWNKSATAADSGNVRLLSDMVNAKGGSISRIEIPPGEHPHADHMRTMLMLVQVFGSLALVLASTLTANVLGMILARHTREVGIMKAIGASSRQIATVYSVSILTVAIPAVCLGIGCGAWLGTFFAQSVGPMLNLEIGSWRIPPRVFGGLFVLALGIPSLAAMIPIARASRITPCGAISHSGITGKKWNSERPSGLWFPVSRPNLLALRNTFRRPVRLVLTVATLGIGGALLLTSANVHTGLIKAVDTALNVKNTDVEIHLGEPAPTEQILEAVNGILGVESTETWGMALVSILDENGSAESGSRRYGIYAPPRPLPSLGLKLAGGRWPDPDEHAVVINQHLSHREPALKIGGEITLLGHNSRLTVTICGVTEELGQPAIYATNSTLDEMTGSPGHSAYLRAKATEGLALPDLALAIETAIVEQGFFPTFVVTRTDFRKGLVDHFILMLIVLSGAALAAIAVGCMSLATTSSINILERSRETGVLRAIGARPGDIGRIFALEGLLTGALSCLLSVLIAMPLTLAVGSIVARNGLHVPMPFVFSWLPIAAWILLSTVISTVTTLLPARRAIRIPVRQALNQ